MTLPQAKGHSEPAEAGPGKAGVPPGDFAGSEVLPAPRCWTPCLQGHVYPELGRLSFSLSSRMRANIHSAFQNRHHTEHIFLCCSHVTWDQPRGHQPRTAPWGWGLRSCAQVTALRPLPRRDGGGEAGQTCLSHLYPGCRLHSQARPSPSLWTRSLSDLPSNLIIRAQTRCLRSLRTRLPIRLDLRFGRWMLKPSSLKTACFAIQKLPFSRLVFSLMKFKSCSESQSRGFHSFTI